MGLGLLFYILLGFRKVLLGFVGFEGRRACSGLRIGGVGVKVESMQAEIPFPRRGY